MAKEPGGEEDPVTIKKYANRRLYNTATSSYVTLDQLSRMVKDGVEFAVYDAKTGENITRSVLTQIIFEEESKGQNLLPIQFLRQLIGFYGDSLQNLVPSYLEMSMESFCRNQEQMRKSLTDTFGDMFSFRQIEEMGRQNMAMFQQAMRMFNPFASMAEARGKKKEEAPSEPVEQNAGADRTELARLREQIEQMQRQLDTLVEKK